MTIKTGLAIVVLLLLRFLLSYLLNILSFVRLLSIFVFHLAIETSLSTRRSSPNETMCTLIK
jgi:ABC-type iron transport system FetAB permease component